MTPIVREISVLDSRPPEYTPILLACNSPRRPLLESLLKPQCTTEWDSFGLARHSPAGNVLAAGTGDPRLQAKRKARATRLSHPQTHALRERSILKSAAESSRLFTHPYSQARFFAAELPLSPPFHPRSWWAMFARCRLGVLVSAGAPAFLATCLTSSG